MVASAAVVVIDFVANWLLKKLRGPASKIGGRIKAIAQKILAKLKRGARKVGGALKRVGRRIKRKLRAGKQRFDNWRARRQARRGAGGKTDPGKRKQDKERRKAERLRKAVEAIRPQVRALAGRGKFSGLVLRAKLLYWKLRYRLTSLVLKGEQDQVQLLATVNPSENVMAFVRKNGRTLRAIIYEVGREIMDRDDVNAAVARLQERMDEGAGRGGKKAQRLELDSGTDALALAKILGKDRERGTTFVQFAGGGRASVMRKERRRTNKALLGPGNQEVTGGGSYKDHASMFSDAATRDSFMSQRGGSATDVQSLANVTMLGGGSRHRDRATRDFAARQALLKIVEMSRNNQAVVVSTDLAQLHGQGGIDHATALRDDPMVPGGAVGTGRKLESKTMGHDSDAGNKGDVSLRANASKLKHMKEQQLTYIAGIMEAKYGAENVMFSSEAAVTDAVRADVKKSIKQLTEHNLNLPHSL
jgi:Skp family chaperone for outer membrane proteins